MAVSYQLPSYLRGNTPGELGSLARAGAQLQLEKQRMSQQAQQDQTAMAIRAEQASQESEQQQARMETEKAYHQIQTQMRQKELDQAGQLIQERTQAAAQKFQAQMQYQQAIQSGMDPEQAILQFGPAMGQSSSSVAIAQGKANRGAQIPASIVDEQRFGQNGVKITQPNGHVAWQPVRNPSEKDPSIAEARKVNERLKIMQAKQKLANESGFNIGQTELPEKNATTGKPTSEGTKADFKSFLEQSKKLDEEMARINSGGSSTTTGTSGAKRLRYDPKTQTLQSAESDQTQDPPEEE